MPLGIFALAASAYFDAEDIQPRVLTSLLQAALKGTPLSTELLRACANRSWPSGRTTFPAVASPALPDESTYDDDHLREGHPEVDHPSAPLRAPEELFVGVLCHELVLSTTHRLVAPSGEGLPFWEISAMSSRSSSRSRVAPES
jgi:hypothetical protein